MKKQMGLFDKRETAVALPPGSHKPKAFYSAAPGGMVVCHRCREKMRRDEVAAHTAVCWPECGR